MSDRSQRRLVVLRVLVGSILLTLSGRPSYLQVVRLDGFVGPPGTRVPARPASLSPSPVPHPVALGPADLPAAEPPRRTASSGRLGR